MRSAQLGAGTHWVALPMAAERVVQLGEPNAFWLSVRPQGAAAAAIGAEGVTLGTPESPTADGNWIADPQCRKLNVTRTARGKCRPILGLRSTG